MSFEVLLFDTGACQWRCGRAEEQGPDVVLPGVAAGDTEAWQRQIKAAIEQLEADPAECALILSEPPATTAAQRAERADFLFALGLQSVHFAAAPLLAIYDAGFDTGMVVDVGQHAAYIYAIVDGCPHPSLSPSQGHTPHGHRMVVHHSLALTLALALTPTSSRRP